MQSFPIISVFLSVILNVTSKSYRSINVANKVNTFFQLGPLNDVISQSLDLSLNHCSREFQWDKWNCPKADFLAKRSSSTYDRESGFVQAITVAALLYTLSRNCSSPEIGLCGCNFTQINGQSTFELNCMDRFNYVEQTVRNLFERRDEQLLNIQDFVTVHNSRMGRLAVRRSLKRNCRCSDLSDHCLPEACTLSLGSFSEIAQNIRRMFDRSILLSVDNHGVFNKNANEHSLVYISESPNFCLMNAIPEWMGSKGRQCSKNKGYSIGRYEKKSCKTLCRSCGLHVKRKLIVRKRKCNCKFNWCCNVTCDICEDIQYEFYCD